MAAIHGKIILDINLYNGIYEVFSLYMVIKLNRSKKVEIVVDKWCILWYYSQALERAGRSSQRVAKKVKKLLDF